MSASRNMEKHYQESWGGERPGNDGGTNKWTGAQEGKPDVVGALLGGADVECKLRGTVASWLVKGVDAITKKCAGRDITPLVLIVPKHGGDWSDDFFVMNRTTFEQRIIPRIIADGKLIPALADRVEALKLSAQIVELEISFDDGSSQTQRWSPQIFTSTRWLERENHNPSWKLVDDGYAAILEMQRNIPIYLKAWRAQITKHTNFNGRLAVIVLHTKRREYETDLIIIPRPSFERWFGSTIAVRTKFMRPVSIHRPIANVTCIAATFDDGNRQEWEIT